MEMSREVSECEDGTISVEAVVDFGNSGGDTRPHTTLFDIMSNHKNDQIPHDAPRH